MARLIVVIDARRAREGADQYESAQNQIRTSARRTAEETAATNARTIDSTLAALDREIERRKAVVEAQSRGVEEGRIEAKAQETINALRAKGITLSDQEIAKIREKTRASQELANAIESTIRAARNADQANAIAGAQRGRAYERSNEGGPQFGPVTAEQAAEEASRAHEKFARQLNETRGWIGDIGDAFDYVGKQILGLSDAQSKAASTSIMMTEKGMALGETFGPQYAIVGGVAGAFLGFAAAAFEAEKAQQKLIKSAQDYQNQIEQSRAADEMRRQFEIAFLGAEKLRTSLGDLSKINISDVTNKINELDTIEFDPSGGGEKWKAAQLAIAKASAEAANDVSAAYLKLSDNMGELSKKNTTQKEQETESLVALQGRAAMAQDNAKNATREVERYQVKLKEAAAEALRLEAQARAEYANDRNEDKLGKKLGEIKDSARALFSVAGDISAKEKAAADAALAAQERYQTAVEKSQTSVKEWGAALLGVATQADSALAGGYLGKLAEVIGSDAFDKAVSEKNAKDKAAKSAAENAAKSRADSLKKQQEQIAAQQAIWAAYEKGGEEAAKIEEKYQSLIAGNGYNAVQLAQARQNAEQIVANENRITDARKTATEAEKEKQKVEEDARKAREKAIDEAKKAAEALEELEDKATKPGQDLAEKEKSPAQVWIEQYDSMLDAQANFEQSIVGSFDNISNALAQTLWGVDTDWKELMKNMGVELTALLIKMAMAAALKAAISGATGGIGGALGAGLIGDLIVGASFHSGGTVGAGGSPMVAPASLFSAAPRFHGGLRPDEFPAILQTGEQVLSRQQVAEGRGQGAAGKIINITNYFPDVKDSRGFGRSLSQQSSRMKRMIGGDS